MNTLNNFHQFTHKSNTKKTVIEAGGEYDEKVYKMKIPKFQAIASISTHSRTTTRAILKAPNQKL